MEQRPKNCIDCNKPITRRATRCYSCQNSTRVGIRNSNYGKKHKGLNSGKNNPMFGKPTPHGHWIIYNDHKFRSSWEAKFAQYLDLIHVKWEYESKTFDLGNTTYTPDFYLPEYDVYVEIKGYWRDDAKKKFKLFRKQLPKINIHILQQDNLKNLGII